MQTLEWRRRIDHWRSVMVKLLTVPVAEVAFEGFVSTDSLTPPEALKRRFKPMPAGTPWGGKWAYGWFKATITLPKSVAGERVVLQANVGGESAILIDGAHQGATDHWHKTITLTNRAKGGERFSVLIESYAGHGPMVVGGGPVPHGELTVPEPGPSQVSVGTSRIAIWEEELYQLSMDTETLVQLRDAMADRESLRVAEIDDALKRLTLVVDLELPRAAMMKTVRAGRALLKPLLDQRNGSTAPRMSCFGHSHIDVAWLWPLQETERKCSRTFASQLALMREYPEYKFLQSQAHLYWMVKTRYPQLYQRVKAAAKKGQWVVDGAMWVEPDTNVTGGESLIRQFIHGKRFFREEFGVDSRLMWLPDVFGYSGSLPQIMKGCGIDHFSTQKIAWTYNGGDPFPHNLFWWTGIDGTRVLSYLHNDYNSESTPTAIMARWNERVQKDATHKGRLVPFGWGDGGGGPTRDHLEYLRRERDLEGLPRCVIETPADFFASADTAGIPTWVGELYYQAHRGTYTSQAKTKLLNRRSEFALREAELWGAAAGARSGARWPQVEADRLWQLVLLNQFHDIIPGSSIHRVYEEAEASYAEAVRGAQALAASAQAKLVAKRAQAITVFNALSWERNALVELPAGWSGAETSEGAALRVQTEGSKRWALVPRVPSCGWQSVRRSSARPERGAAAPLRADRRGLENEHLAITVDASGALTAIVDKASGQDFAAGPCNRLRMYKDVPGWFDAWDIDSMYAQQPVELDGAATVEVISTGPLWAALRVRRTINESTISQDIVLRAGSRRVEFVTTVDWREKHKLLKVDFPVDVRSEDALHEIQFGHVRRPTHATRPYDATRFEVCNHKWTALAEEARGAAVLNDSKYGVNVVDRTISLTLLRSPLSPDMTADRGIQQFTYAFQCWTGPFEGSGVIQAGYELNAPVSVAAGEAERASLFALDAANVIIETVKPAEDGSGDVIVRMYEALRTQTRCALRVGLPFGAVSEVDMLEAPVAKLKASDGRVALTFRPFEIKTLRLTRR